MSYERDEYLELIKEKSSERLSTTAGDLRMLVQAGIAAEYVTNDQHWDHYLRTIQGVIEQTKEQLETIKNALAGTTFMNAEDMMSLKMDANRCQERIACLEAVVALPSQIMAKGKEAEMAMEKIAVD